MGVIFNIQFIFIIFLYIVFRIEDTLLHEDEFILKDDSKNID
jgi:hypothetical protein